MACAKASKHVLCIYFQNGTPKDSVSMITMNGKLYIHWRFIPSCHFMLQKFLVRLQDLQDHFDEIPSLSRTLGENKTPISNLSHWYLPSCEGGQNPSCRDLTVRGANGWVAGTFPTYYANSISPNLHLP